MISKDGENLMNPVERVADAAVRTKPESGCEQAIRHIQFLLGYRLRQSPHHLDTNLLIASPSAIASQVDNSGT